MKRISVLALAMVLLVSASLGGAAETVKIGVLANNGPVKAMQKWKATAEYLSTKIPGTGFEIVPLDFAAVYPAVEAGKVDFFLVNSSMFVTTQVKYGARAVATMINSRQGQPLTAFGGVILASSENDAVNSLADLKGKTFMAVSATSLGGWQMAQKELVDAGIDIEKDLAKLEFGGKHENVVMAVLNGVVDAGTVRTDTLERMAATGDIDMGEIKVLNPRQHEGFPFVCSTALYPEWPLAKTAKTGDAMAEQVLNALRAMKPEDQAAKDAKVVGWTEALDYTPVQELQKKLKIDAYAAE
jgi:phosphate/phosphite/phosphonate ABC transporter binding protein